MKLTIFGATGRTGQYLLPLALTAGHEVTVLVRSPEKLPQTAETLTVIQGDIGDAAKVNAAIAGAGAVISVLGPTSNTPAYAVSQGMQQIISAMQGRGVRRLVISAGAGVADANDQPKVADKVIGFLVRTLSRHVYEDMVRAVDVVRRSGLDWTIVRVPMLTDGPAQGQVKVAYVGKGLGTRITRADLAAFMLEQVADEGYLRQAPGISN